jgi:hypothetical protein
MHERCLEQERLANAVTLAVTATNGKKADRIRAVKEKRNADPQTVALFDAHAIERGAVFALDQHKIAHRCFESKNETWAVSIESTQIGSDYIF